MGVFYPSLKIVGKTMHLRSGTTDESYTEIITILPANAYIVGIYGRVKTAFVGLTNPKVSVGVSGDTSRYMVAQPINKVGELMYGKLVKSTGGINKSSVSLPDKYKRDLPHTKNFCEGMPHAMISPSNVTIIATFTSDSTNFSNVSAGEVEVIVLYINPEALP